jgi:hypothetical protein
VDSGGGGGASSVGASADGLAFPSGVFPHGGDGTASSITGTSYTWAGGGGGGGHYTTSKAGNGGAGGGGGAAGTNNSGTGGAGLNSGANGSGTTGGAGGTNTGGGVAVVVEPIQAQAAQAAPASLFLNTLLLLKPHSYTKQVVLGLVRLV